MLEPDTHFAVGPEGMVAYQTLGDGPFDILFIPPWTWNIEVMWEEPRIERYFRRLSSFSRVIVFDKRGTGVSDPVPFGAMPTLEEWTEDIRVVLDAVGSDKAAVIATLEGGQMGLLFAAVHPDRTSALVVLNGAACYLRAEDYPIGVPRDRVEEMPRKVWAADTDRVAEWFAPSLKHDERFRRWWSHFERLSVPPGVREAMYLHGTRWDVRAALPTISAPTLVLHHRDIDYIRASFGGYIAENVQDARYVELPGADALFFAADHEPQLTEIENFLTGMTGSSDHDRVLATVLFTDIVGSTERATALGDTRWRDLLDLHDRLVAEQVVRFRGRVVKTTGDGILAIFDGPARATRCAQQIVAAVQTLGIEIRAGLHAGEVELRGSDVGGIAVNIAARVLAEAHDGEVLVSRTVRDLVVGSGLAFQDRGDFDLKGVAERWQLFATTMA